MATRRVIVSRHVVFDETMFPFVAAPSAASVPSSLDFLMQGLSPPADTPPPTAIERPSAPLPSSKAVLLDYQDPAIIYASPLDLPSRVPLVAPTPVDGGLLLLRTQANRAALVSPTSDGVDHPPRLRHQQH